MPFIMRGKNESAAYFEQEITLDRTQAFIEEYNARATRKISLFHLYTWALAQTLTARPRLNRFIAGSKVYQRNGIWVSYSAKKAMSDDSPVVVRKCEVDPAMPFPELVEKLSSDVVEGKSAKKSHVDKELGIVLAFPAFILRMLITLQVWLDAWNLLPFSLIGPDPLYASIFVANLGSLKMDPVFHHLYEYGNIPIFACIGKRHRVARPDDHGTITTPLVCTVKYTYDERIEDGLYCAAGLDHLRKLLEDPEAAGLSLPALASAPPVSAIASAA